MNNHSKLPTVKATTREEARQMSRDVLKTLNIDSFAIVPVEILRTKKLSGGAKLVWATLRSYAWMSEQCYPGQDRLMEELSIKSIKTLRKYLKELKSSGLLTWQQTGLNLPNVYTLIGPSDLMKAEFVKEQAEISTRLDRVKKNAQSGWGKKCTTNYMKEEIKEDVINSGISAESVDQPLRENTPTQKPQSEPTKETFNLVGKSTPTSVQHAPSSDSAPGLAPPLYYSENPPHEVFMMFCDYYQQIFKEEHPPLKSEQYERVMKAISDWQVGEEEIQVYFTSKFKKPTDYRIHHFATDGVLKNLSEKVRCPETMSNEQYQAIYQESEDE